MCPRTWLPSPRTKRPRESFWMLHADIAVMVGLRGKAIATAVVRRRRVEPAAASAMTTYGSTLVSSTARPS
jgi:hypothetical protein